MARRRREKNKRTPATDVAAARAARLSTRDWACAIGLLVLSALLYVQVLGFEFVDYDDDQYVTQNAQVQKGLSPQTIEWAFTTTHFANWLPVTWLSHLLDVSLYGLKPGGHHATSAVLHGVNTMLVFLILRRMTGFAGRSFAGRSFAVALLFAVHPLRVESVAWIAERKDVLCGTFFLLTLLAYDAWVRGRRVWTYVAACVLYALGLMAKTMIVTMPFLLLVIDAWPLRRFDGDVPVAKRFLQLLREKVPLLLLAAIACAWTVRFQESGGALSNLKGLTLSQRLGNAVVSVPRYLGKIVWPTELSALYPHPGTWPAWRVWASVGFIVAVTTAVLVLRRRKPYLAVGWLWFCGMLLPVVGIVQAGLQSMADRYTYLPGIGLAVAAVWAVAEALERRPAAWRTGAAVALGVICVVLSVATVRQQRVWRDTFSLMSQMIAVTENNYVAHGHLGKQYELRNDIPTAEQHLAEAARLNPRYLEAWYNWGNLLIRQRRPAEAAERYRTAISVVPRHAESHLGLGTAYAMSADFAAAEREYREALRLRPDWNDAMANLAAAVRNQGRLPEAYSIYEQVLRVDPDNARALRGLAELTATPAPSPVVPPTSAPLPQQPAPPK